MNPNAKTPVLFLKTKSSIGDAYEERFSTETDGFRFGPSFIPVLEHRFDEEGLSRTGKLLAEQSIGSSAGKAYGGLIFTSQRAVEAFAKLVERGKGDVGWPHLQKVPVYSVGPATTRALKAVQQEPSLNVFGEHTGNGGELAEFILEHYSEWYRDFPTKPPLIFLVGEQRRDIIPKTLMNPGLPEDIRIHVDEIVVYGSGVMESFQEDFQKALRETEDLPMKWIVVFSPTGCNVMLQELARLQHDTGKQTGLKASDRTTFIATIGPTTRDYLQKVFSHDPDVCAAQPSPDGVWNGIVDFIRRRRSR